MIDGNDVVRRLVSLLGDDPSEAKRYRVQVTPLDGPADEVPTGVQATLLQRVGDALGLANLTGASLFTSVYVAPAPSPPPEPPPSPTPSSPGACGNECAGTTCIEMAVRESCDELAVRGCDCSACCRVSIPSFCTPLPPPVPSLPGPLPPPSIPAHPSPEPSINMPLACLRPCAADLGRVGTCGDFQFVVTCATSAAWSDCDCTGCCYDVLPPLLPPALPPLPPLSPPVPPPATPPVSPPPPSPPPPAIELELGGSLQLDDLQQVFDGEDELSGKIVHVHLVHRQQRRRLDHNHHGMSPGSIHRHLEVADDAIAPHLVFSSRTLPSEVVIEGGWPAVTLLRADAARPSILMLAGSPTVTLRRLHLQGSGGYGAPALNVSASLLIVEDCVLSNHAVAAIHVSGAAAAVRIIGSSFKRNGNAALAQGGAVHARSFAAVEILRSEFTLNIAVDGGAIFTNRARLDVYESVLVENYANGSGGAIHAVKSRLHLRNGTMLRANVAMVSGQSVYLKESHALYVLPAPLGRFVPGSIACDGSTSALPTCEHEHSGMHVAPLHSPALDDYYYPPLCSAGFVGWTSAPPAQSSPSCAGLCPAGKYCLHGTVNPQPCSLGSYCVVGSPLPVPCQPGSYGASSGLTSQQDCTPCPAGSWCSGGLRIDCSVGSFNPQTGSNSSFSCEPCPGLYATTHTSGATRQEHCQCLPGYVRTTHNISKESCRPCPPGASCDDIGTTVQTLFVMPGYFRPSSDTLDVRKCDDRLSNCSWSACPDSTSGCRGGSSQLATCAPTLMGPFCSLCNASADVSSPDGPHSAPMGRMFYVGATQGTGSGAVAHCEDCGWNGLRVWLLWVAASVSVVLSHTAVYVLRRHAASSRGLLARWANFVRLAFQVSSGDIKLVVAFLLIATSIGDVYDIEFPRQTQQLLTLLRVPISLGLDSVFEGYLFQCIGLDGYLSHAASWMCLPWYLYTLILLAAALRARCAKEPISWRLLVERSADTMFRVLFLLYPSLVRIAFSAFDCHHFDNGQSWMKADVSITCGSAEHQRSIACAGVMIVVYVAGDASDIHAAHRSRPSDIHCSSPSRSTHVRIVPCLFPVCGPTRCPSWLLASSRSCLWHVASRGAAQAECCTRAKRQFQPGSCAGAQRLQARMLLLVGG